MRETWRDDTSILSVTPVTSTLGRHLAYNHDLKECEPISGDEEDVPGSALIICNIIGRMDSHSELEDTRNVLQDHFNLRVCCVSRQTKQQLLITPWYGGSLLLDVDAEC